MAVRFNNYEPGAAFASLLNSQDQAYQDRLALGWVPSERDPDDGWIGSLWDSAHASFDTTLGGALNTLGILTNNETIYGWGNDLNKTGAALTDRNNDYNDGTKSRLSLEYLTDPHGLWNEGGTLLGSSLPGMAAGTLIAASAPEAAVFGGIAALASAGMEMGANFGQGYTDKKRDSVEQAIKNGDRSQSVWDNNIDQGAWADLTKDPYKNAELMASSLMDTALDVAGGATKGLGSMIAKETGLGKALASNGGKVVESMLGDSVRSETLLGKALNVANEARIPAISRYLGDRAVDAGVEGFQEAWQQRIQDAMNGNFDDDGTGRDKALSFFDSIAGNSDFTDDEKNAFESAAFPTLVKGVAGSGLRTARQKIDNAYFAPKEEDRASENMFHISTIDAANDDGTAGAQFSVFDKFDNNNRHNVLEGLSNANLDAINTNIDAFNKANEALPEDQRPSVVEHLTPEMIETAKGDSNEAALATRNISNALLIPENRSVLSETVKGAREGRKASISETKENIKNTIKALGNNDESTVKSGIDSANNIISAVSPTWAASDINELSKGVTYTINQATMDAAKNGDTKALRDVLRAIKPDAHVDTVKGRRRKNESYKREIQKELDAFSKDFKKEHITRAESLNNDAKSKSIFTEEESSNLANEIREVNNGKTLAPEKQITTIDANAKVTDEKVANEDVQNTQDAQNAPKTDSERGVEGEQQVEGVTTTPTKGDVQKQASTAQNTQSKGQQQKEIPQDNNAAQEPVKDTVTPVESGDVQNTTKQDTQNPQNGVKTDSERGIGEVPNAQGVTTTPTAAEAPKSPVKPTKEQNKRAGNIGGRITKYGNSIKAGKRKPEDVKAFADKVEEDINKADLTEEQKRNLLDKIAKIRAGIGNDTANQPTSAPVPQASNGAEVTTNKPTNVNNVVQNGGEQTNESDKGTASKAGQATEGGKDNETKEGTEARGSEGEQGRSTETNSSDQTKETNSEDVTSTSTESSAVNQDEAEQENEYGNIDETDDSFELDIKPDDDAVTTDEEYETRIRNKLKDMTGKEETEISKQLKAPEQKENKSERLKRLDNQLNRTFGFNAALSDTLTMQCIDGAANFINNSPIGVAKKIIGRTLEKLGVKENIDYLKYRALLGPLLRQGYNYIGTQFGTTPGLSETGGYAQGTREMSLGIYNVLFPAINTAILNYKDFRKRAVNAGITPASLNTYFFYCLQTALNDYKDNLGNNGVITRFQKKNLKLTTISNFLYEDKSLYGTGVYEEFINKLNKKLKEKKVDLSVIGMTEDDVMSMFPDAPDGNSYIDYISSVIGTAADKRAALYRKRGGKWVAPEEVLIETFVDYVKAISKNKAKKQELAERKEISEVAEVYGRDRNADKKLKDEIRKGIGTGLKELYPILKRLVKDDPMNSLESCFDYATNGMKWDKEKRGAMMAAADSVLNSLRLSKYVRNEALSFAGKAIRSIQNRLGYTADDQMLIGVPDLLPDNGIKVRDIREITHSYKPEKGNGGLASAAKYIKDALAKNDNDRIEHALLAMLYVDMSGFPETDKLVPNIHFAGDYKNLVDGYDIAPASLGEAKMNLLKKLVAGAIDLSADDLKEIAKLREEFFGKREPSKEKGTAQSEGKGGPEPKGEGAAVTGGPKSASYEGSAQAESEGIGGAEWRAPELANLKFLLAMSKIHSADQEHAVSIVYDLSMFSCIVNVLALDSFVISSVLDLHNASVKNGFYDKPMSVVNKAYHLQAHLVKYAHDGGNYEYAYDIVKKIRNVLPTYKAYRTGKNGVLKGKEARDFLNSLIKEMSSSNEGRIALGLKRDKNGKLYDKFGLIGAHTTIERTPNDERNRLAPAKKKNSVYNQKGPVKITAKYGNVKKINNLIKNLEDAVNGMGLTRTEKEDTINRLRGAMMNLNRTISSIERQAERNFSPTDPLASLKSIFAAKHELTKFDSVIFETFMIKKTEDILSKMLKDAKSKGKRVRLQNNFDPGLRTKPNGPSAVLAYAGRTESDKDFTTSFGRDDPNIIRYNGKMYRLTDGQKKKYDSFLNKDGTISDEKLEERERFCSNVCVDPGKEGRGKSNRIIEFPYSNRFSGVANPTNQLTDRYGYSYLNGARLSTNNGEYVYKAPDGLSTYIDTLANVFFEKADEEGTVYNNNLIRAIVLKGMLKDGKFNAEEIRRLSEQTKNFEDSDKLIELAESALEDINTFIESDMLNRAAKLAERNRRAVSEKEKSKTFVGDASTHQTNYISEDVQLAERERDKRERAKARAEMRRAERENVKGTSGDASDVWKGPTGKAPRNTVKGVQAGTDKAPNGEYADGALGAPILFHLPDKNEMLTGVARALANVRRAKVGAEQKAKEEQALNRARAVCSNISRSLRACRKALKDHKLSPRLLKNALVKIGKAYAKCDISKAMYDVYMKQLKDLAIEYKLEEMKKNDTVSQGTKVEDYIVTSTPKPTGKRAAIGVTHIELGSGYSEMTNWEKRDFIVRLMNLGQIKINEAINKAISVCTKLNQFGEYPLSPFVSKKIDVVLPVIEGTNILNAAGMRFKEYEMYQTTAPLYELGTPNPLQEIFANSLWNLADDFSMYEFDDNWFDDTPNGKILNLEKVDVSKLENAQKRRLLFILSYEVMESGCITSKELSTLQSLFDMSNELLAEVYGDKVCLALLGLDETVKKWVDSPYFTPTTITDTLLLNDEVTSVTSLLMEKVPTLPKVKNFSKTFKGRVEKAKKIIQDSLEKASVRLTQKSYSDYIVDYIKSKYGTGVVGTVTHSQEEGVLFYRLLKNFHRKFGDSVPVHGQLDGGSFNSRSGILSDAESSTLAHEMSHAIMDMLISQDLESGKLVSRPKRKDIVYSKKLDNSGDELSEAVSALRVFLRGAMKEFDGRDDAVSITAKSVFDMLPEEFMGPKYLGKIAVNLLRSGIMKITDSGEVTITLKDAAMELEKNHGGYGKQVIAYETVLSLLECAEYIKNNEVYLYAITPLQEAYNYNFNEAVKEGDDETMESWFINTLDMLKKVTGKTKFTTKINRFSYLKKDKAPAIKTKPERKEKKFKQGETGSSPTSNARLGNAKPDDKKYQNFQQNIIKATNGFLGDKMAARTARLKKHPVRWFSKSYKSAISMLREMGIPEEICLRAETLTQTCMSNQQRFHELDQIRLKALADILAVKGNEKSTERIMEEAYRIINNNSDRGRDIVEHVTFGKGQYIKLYAQDIFEVRRGFDNEENAKAFMEEWLDKKMKKMKENGQGKDIVVEKKAYHYSPETGTIIFYVPNKKSLDENGNYKNIGEIKFGKDSNWGKEEAKMMNKDMAECEYLLRKNLKDSPKNYTQDEINRIIRFWRGHKETMLECYLREKKRELLADDIINRQEVGYMHAYSPRVYSRYLLIEKRYSKKPVENPPKDWDSMKDDVFGQYEYERLPDGKVYHVEYAGIGSFSSQRKRWKYRQKHPLTDSKNMYIEATRDEYLNVSGGRNDVTSVSDNDTRTISDEDKALARKRIESHATGKLANLILREIPKDEKFTPNKMRTMVNKLLDDEMENEEGYNTNDIKAMRAVLNSIVDSPGLGKIQTFGEFAEKVKEEGAQYLSAGYAKERNSSSGLYDHDVMAALESYMFTTANIAALAPIHREITKIIKQATGKDYRATKGTSEESLYNLGCEILDTVEGRDAPIDGFIRKLSASTAAFINQMPIFKQIEDATGHYIPELWMTGIMNKGMTWSALILLGCWNIITAGAQYSQMNNVRAYVGESNFLEAMNECKGTILKINTKNVLSGKFDLKQFPPEVQQVLIDQYLTKEGTDSNTLEQEEEFQRRVKEGDEEAVKIQSMVDELGVKDVRTGGVGTNNLAYQVTNAGNQFSPTSNLNPMYRATRFGEFAGKVREVMDSGMAFFRASDTSCRIVAAVAAYKMMNKDEDFQAKLKGKDEKEQSLMKRIYIQDVVNKTNFNFNRATDPILLHNLGQVGRTVFQFGKFGLLNLDYIGNLYHKRGMKGVADYLGSTFLISGIWAGIPCATAFAGICQAVLGWNPEDWMKRFLIKLSTEGKISKPVAEAAMYGIMAPIAGVDISKKVGLADSIRDPTDTKNLLGPVFGKLGEFAEALGATRKFFTDDAFTRDQLFFAYMRSFPMIAKIYQAYTGRYYSYNKFTPKTAEGSMPWDDRVRLLLGGSPISNRMDTDVNRLIIDANKRYSDEIRSAMLEYYSNPSAENEARLAEYGKTGKDAQKMAEKLIKRKLTADEAEAMTTKGKSERARQIRQDARDLGAFLDM